MTHIIFDTLTLNTHLRASISLIAQPYSMVVASTYTLKMVWISGHIYESSSSLDPEVRSRFEKKGWESLSVMPVGLYGRECEPDSH